MTEDKKPEIVFAPGAFDNFEGSQEELDELVAEIQRLVETGEIFEHSRELTDEDLEDLPEDIQQQIVAAFDAEEYQEISRKLQ